MRAFIIIEELKGVGVSGVRVYQSKVSVFVVGLGERWATDSVEQLRLMACRLWGVGCFCRYFWVSTWRFMGNLSGVISALVWIIITIVVVLFAHL